MSWHYILMPFGWLSNLAPCSQHIKNIGQQATDSVHILNLDRSHNLHQCYSQEVNYWHGGSMSKFIPFMLQSKATILIQSYIWVSHLFKFVPFHFLIIFIYWLPSFLSFLSIFLMKLKSSQNTRILVMPEGKIFQRNNNYSTITARCPS